MSVRSLHRWCGWMLGALLLLQVLTGTVVAFRSELNDALYGGAVVAGGARGGSPGRIVEHFNASHPGLVFERLFLPGSVMGERAAVWARAPRDRALHIAVYDADSATLVRSEPLARFPVEWVFFLHSQLLGGIAGQFAVGTVGLMLAFSAVSGFLRWHRTRPAAARSAASPTAFARWLGWHRTIGITVLALALVLALSAGFLGWKVLLSGAPVPLPRSPVRWPTAQEIDGAVGLARDLSPRHLDWSVSVDPLHPQRVTVVRCRSVGMPPRATDQFTIDVRRQALLAAVPFHEQTLKARASAWAHALHSGEILGIAGQALLVALGAALGFMAIAGYRLTVLRRRARSGAR